MKKEYWKITVESVLLALGLYFLGRVVRNNYYYTWVDTNFDSNPSIHIALNYLGHFVFIICLILVFFLNFDEWKKCKPAFTVKANKIIPLLLLGLAVGFAMNAGAIYLSMKNGDMDMKWNGSSILIVLCFFAVAVQSSTEEFVYRGWTYMRMQGKIPLSYAVIGSAIAFSLTHCLNPGMKLLAFINIMLVGAHYALAIKYFGNLWYSAAHHTAWNFSQAFIFGLPNSGNPAEGAIMGPTFVNSSLLYDADFGIEGGWLATIFNVVCIVIFIVLIRKKESKQKTTV